MEALLKKNKEAQTLIEQISSQIEILKKSGLNLSKYEEENIQILKENHELSEKIALVKNDLLKVELLNGSKKIQVDIPEVVKASEVQESKSITVETPKPVEVSTKEEKSKGNIKAEAKPKAAAPKTQESNEVVNVSRFDMRIGKILEIQKHPEADSLYIEQVDVGKGKPIQVISGLVKYCTEAELLGRHAVFLVNLKSAKMRGVLSEGMIMCASAPDQGVVEPLVVPGDVKPGDRVTVEGYEGVPDDVMNPKKKILETVKPDLKVNGDGIATYLGSPWVVNGKPGSILSTKLKNVAIA